MLGPALDPFLEPTDTRLVEGWWCRATDHADLVVPDGAVDVLWSPGRMPWLAGPDTAPRPVELHAGELAVGVRLAPGAGAAAIRGSLETLTDRCAPLDAVLTGRWARELAERLDAAPSPACAAQLLAEALVARAPGGWEPDPVVLETVHALRAGKPVPGVGLSARQHRRRFAAAMGYGPKFYERVCRLDRFTRLLGRDAQRPLAQLAAEAGYFDQAHLARDCQALIGQTPSDLRAGR